MRKLFSIIWILTALLAAAGPALAADQSIDAFEADRQAAWNAHDAAAYAAAFDQNADIITALGWHWTGQAEAAGKLGDGFRYLYAQARLQLATVQIRRLSPELALVTLNWAIDGARAIDSGLPAATQHGLETQLLKRRGDGWLILAQQDTAATAAPVPAQSSTPAPARVAPPETFPTSPPPVRRCIMARAHGQCLIYGKARKPAAD